MSEAVVESGYVPPFGLRDGDIFTFDGQQNHLLIDDQVFNVDKNGCVMYGGTSMGAKTFFGIMKGTLSKVSGGNNKKFPESIPQVAAVSVDTTDRVEEAIDREYVS